MTKKPKQEQFDPIKGRLPVLQYLSPSELLVDSDYQRSIESDDAKALIRKIARQWDWDLCQPLVVSRRAWQENTLFVIDGQHRLEAAKLRGDVTQLPSTIVEYPDAKAEAKAFVLLNQLRRALTRIDLFKAALASGDENALAIKKALDDAGLTLAPHMSTISWKPGQLGNIGGIEFAARQHGIHVTSSALELLAVAFTDEVLNYAGTIFPGLVAVCAEVCKRGRTVPDGEFAAFTAKLRSIGQQRLRQNILTLQGEHPELGRKGAAIAHISGLYWPDRPAIRSIKPKARQAGDRQTFDDQNRFLHFVPDEDGLAWCDQCDMRVSLPEAKSCRSRFCSLKKAANA